MPNYIDWRSPNTKDAARGYRLAAKTIQNKYEFPLLAEQHYLQVIRALELNLIGNGISDILFSSQELLAIRIALETLKEGYLKSIDLNAASEDAISKLHTPPHNVLDQISRGFGTALKLATLLIYWILKTYPRHDLNSIDIEEISITLSRRIELSSLSQALKLLEPGQIDANVELIKIGENNFKVAIIKGSRLDIMLLSQKKSIANLAHKEIMPLIAQYILPSFTFRTEHVTFEDILVRFPHLISTISKIMAFAIFLEESEIPVQTGLKTYFLDSLTELLSSNGFARNNLVTQLPGVQQKGVKVKDLRGSILPNSPLATLLAEAQSKVGLPNIFSNYNVIGCPASLGDDLTIKKLMISCKSVIQRLRTTTVKGQTQLSLIIGSARSAIERINKLEK